MLQSSKLLKSSMGCHRGFSLGSCHWGWERQTLSSVAFIHACLSFPLDYSPSNGCLLPTQSTDTSGLYLNCVCLVVCLSDQLHKALFSRCIVQLVVRNCSQPCDSLSPRARTVILPAARSRGADLCHSPYEYISVTFSQCICISPMLYCIELELSNSCSAVTTTVNLIPHTVNVNISEWLIH